jgi:sugar phosphate isomerase/epimerase
MTLRLRIGNQTSKHARPITAPFDFALQAGFDAFEWFSDGGREGWCEELADADERRRLRNLGRDRDLLYSVHAPYAAAPFDAEGAAAIARSIDFAAAVGAGVVNVHLFAERGGEAFAQALLPLLRRARAVGVRVSVENTPETTPEHFNAAFAALARYADVAGAVGMCLDMGHANLCQATRNDFLGYVDRLGPQVSIIHWHAHENWGDRDGHLTLFTGPSARDDAGVRGLVRRLRKRGFTGSAVLEQWPSPPGLLAQARDRLRALWDEETARAG